MGGETRPTHYDVMGLPPTASQAEISVRYWELMPLAHPDNSGDPYLLAALNEAYDAISDPTARRAYDLMIGLSEWTEPPEPESTFDWTKDRWEMVDPDGETQPQGGPMAWIGKGLNLAMIAGILLTATSSAILGFYVFVLALAVVPIILLWLATRSR